jgi:putative transposase
MRKKIVSPGHRKEVALGVVARGLCSGRAACRFLHLSRSTYWYRARPPSARQSRLLKRLHELSERHPRYGYRRIAALLRQEAWEVGKRQVQRLRRAEGLRVPPTRRKAVRRGVSTGLPTKATRRGHVWTWDFVSDATVRGGAIRMLTILDEHTRECHVLRADRALRTADVLDWLGRAIQEHGAPEYLRSDNGPEFIAKEVQRWLAEKKIKTIYIDPGSPWQNGFVESFHGRFRDECLKRFAALDANGGEGRH